MLGLEETLKIIFHRDAFHQTRLLKDLSNLASIFSNLELGHLLYEVLSMNSTGCNLHYQCTLLILIYDIKYCEIDLKLNCGFIVKKLFLFFLENIKTVSSIL